MRRCAEEVMQKGLGAISSKLETHFVSI